MDKVLNGKKILLTGATGLIGRAIVKRLRRYEVHIVAVVRSVDRAEKLLGNEKITFIEGDIVSFDLSDKDIDYIIHAAANTSSKAFVNTPVEVITDEFFGMNNILEKASKINVKSVVFLSTMEVYGTPDTDIKIPETCSGNLNSMSVRSCYPEGKRACENLCVSYYKQYGVPVKVVRLTQTFGPGVKYDDERVFAEFARCVIEKRDIILHTSGDTKRSYLYIDDAVEGIITVLLKGKSGEAYNLANEDTYCSVYEMAKMVVSKFGGSEIDVIIKQENDLSKFGYAPTLRMNLDTTKIMELGWRPTVDLEEMYSKMIESMRGEEGTLAKLIID